MSRIATGQKCATTHPSPAIGRATVHVPSPVVNARRRRHRAAQRRRLRRRWSQRAGFTILELLVALGLFLAIAFLTAAVVDVQRQGLVTTIQGARARRTAAQAVDVVAAQLRGAAASDITIASDTAIEFQLPLAEGVVCEAPSGSLVVLPPLGRAGAGSRTRWRAMPEADDAALFLDPTDLASGVWRRATIVAATLRNDPTLCRAPSGLTVGYTAPDMAGEPRLELSLDALPTGVVAGTVVRVQRRLRLVTYRSADGSGQLGLRRCPADSAVPCGGVQPAVGPLRPPAAREENAGFRFAYLDSAGVEVGAADPSRIAIVQVLARAPRLGGNEVARAWLALRGR